VRCEAPWHRCNAAQERDRLVHVFDTHQRDDRQERVSDRDAEEDRARQGLDEVGGARVGERDEAALAEALVARRHDQEEDLAPGEPRRHLDARATLSSSRTPFHVLPHPVPCFVHMGATLSSSLTPFHMFRSHGGSFSESRGPHGPVSGGTVNFGGSGTASSATPLLSACACSFFAFLIAICVQDAIKKVSKVQSRRCPRCNQEGVQGAIKKVSKVQSRRYPRCKPHACPGARP
jgi:hypothetical protein